MIQYVEGFLVSKESRRVVLLHKDRGPADIVGKWNGPGGKMEPGESPLAAMSREYVEETGLYLSNWQHRLILYKPNEWVLYAFVNYSSDDILDMAEAQESERVDVFSIDDLPHNVVPNLRWMIPLVTDENVRCLPTILVS